MPISYQAAVNAPMLAPEEEREALARWQEQRDPSALELLVLSHARQAYAHASRWTDNPVHLEDLVAEGVLGLMRAADRFDRSRDVRFSTYSSYWVMTFISSALARIKSVVDIPPRTYLDALGGRLAGEDQRLAHSAIQTAVPIDAPTVGDDGPNPADRLVSEDPTPEERVTARSTAAAMERLTLEALAKLDPLERQVIERRKLRPVPEAASAVAADLGLSADRMRQIEVRALRKMRRVLLERGFSTAMLE